jgi:DNA-binding transcriptional regulator GbsR (MarR family)
VTVGTGRGKGTILTPGQLEALYYLRHGPLRPRELASLTDKSYSEIFSIVDSLIEKKLVKKYKFKGQYVFEAVNPLSYEYNGATITITFHNSEKFI